MAKLYHQGDTLRLQCSFTVDGTLTDPTTVTLYIMNPNSTTPTTYTYGAAQITKSGTGVYYKDINFNLEGVWHWRWLSTGAVAAADEGDVIVKSGPL